MIRFTAAAPWRLLILGLRRLLLSDPVGGEAVFPRALPMDRRNSVALLEMGPLRLEAGY